MHYGKDNKNAEIGYESAIAAVVKQPLLYSKRLQKDFSIANGL